MQSVMALDWDTVSGGLWAVCDNTCNAGAGATTFIELNGTVAPAVSTFAQPAGLPAGGESVANFEGFATAPAVLMNTAAPAAMNTFAQATAASGDARPVWWTRDGHASGALFAGTVFAVPTAAPGEAPGAGNGPGTDTGGGAGESGAGSGPGSSNTGGISAGEGSLANTGGENMLPMFVTIAVLALLGGGLIAYARLAPNRERRETHLK